MTSIVKNKSNKYFIAKKVPIDDEKTMHEVDNLFNTDLAYEIIVTSKYNCASWDYLRIEVGLYHWGILWIGRFAVLSQTTN